MSLAPVSAGRKNAFVLFGVGVAALLVAVIAALLLAPTQGPPSPDPAAAAQVVSERFTAAELSRAEDFRSSLRAVSLVELLFQFILLGVFAFLRGAGLKRTIDRLARRPLLGAMVAGAGIALALALIGLPFDLAGWKIGRDYGLVNQALDARLADWALGSVIAVVPAAVGSLLALLLWRRLRGRFWLAASVLIGLWAIVTTWLWPVVVSPLFNEFEPLPEGPVRAEMLRLSDRAGVEVGEVYVVDASRRSSTLNAYVTGIGSSRRVVLYDNTIESLTPAELSALVSHELGHVQGHDLRRGLGYALLVIPLGALFVQMATRTVLGRNGDDLDGPAVIPVLALMLSLATLILQVPGNALSRSIEEKSDRVAIALTDNPQGLVDLQVRLAKGNLSDIDPPPFWHFVFGTHPTTIDRIAIAEGAR